MSRNNSRTYKGRLKGCQDSESALQIMHILKGMRLSEESNRFSNKEVIGAWAGVV